MPTRAWEAFAWRWLPKNLPKSPVSKHKHLKWLENASDQNHENQGLNDVLAASAGISDWIHQSRFLGNV
jgi:hypothetical protein